MSVFNEPVYLHLAHDHPIRPSNAKDVADGAEPVFSKRSLNPSTCGSGCKARGAGLKSSDLYRGVGGAMQLIHVDKSHKSEAVSGAAGLFRVSPIVSGRPKSGGPGTGKPHGPGAKTGGKSWEERHRVERPTTTNQRVTERNPMMKKLDKRAAARLGVDPEMEIPISKRESWADVYIKGLPRLMSRIRPGGDLTGPQNRSARKVATKTTLSPLGPATEAGRRYFDEISARNAAAAEVPGGTRRLAVESATSFATLHPEYSVRQEGGPIPSRGDSVTIPSSTEPKPAPAKKAPAKKAPAKKAPAKKAPAKKAPKKK